MENLIHSVSDQSASFEKVIKVITEMKYESEVLLHSGDVQWVKNSNFRTIQEIRREKLRFLFE